MHYVKKQRFANNCQPVSLLIRSSEQGCMKLWKPASLQVAGHRGTVLKALLFDSLVFLANEKELQNVA